MVQHDELVCGRFSLDWASLSHFVPVVQKRPEMGIQIALAEDRRKMSVFADALRKYYVDAKASDAV